MDSVTQRLIVRILSELEEGVYTTQLVKLIYLIDYFYFCEEGSTATGLSYFWDEYGPNATGHQIIKEAAVLQEGEVIDIRSAPGGDRARTHHLREQIRPTFNPVLEAIVQDVVRKYGSLKHQDLVALSKETAPFRTARPGKPLIMERAQHEAYEVGAEDWEKHLRERAQRAGKSIAELKAKYGID